MRPVRLSNRSEAILNVNHADSTRLKADGKRSAKALIPNIKCEKQICHMATGGLCSQMWLFPQCL